MSKKLDLKPNFLIQATLANTMAFGIENYLGGNKSKLEAGL
jgi:hypothetical protein